MAKYTSGAGFGKYSNDPLFHNGLKTGCARCSEGNAPVLEQILEQIVEQVLDKSLTNIYT